ncbi:hypothetical protein J2128_001006 [Methanomicrobium sp. W14]|uniref:hypothetical protein n=1 Tax=Methanomicrobium sp. W14 TaxID=2817839 RepID=UPI001AE20976|nr:hypothetical protein [Methanomicrobium sp. W14]MBP2133085.1 hypothetical protein [Methanomicrobium sp. W14]
MRRIYHRFPQRCDLDFDVERPFIDVVEKVAGMNNTHVTQRVGDDLIRLDMHVSVADSKTRMVPVDSVPDLLDTITDAADFMLILNETKLTGERRIPRFETVYYLRVSEKGMLTECIVSREGTRGTTDAYDVKRLITGAFN